MVIIVSFFKSTQLALGLGLRNPYQLNAGFVVSEVNNISDLAPRSILQNNINSNFLGGDQGLPNGAPELGVNPIPTNNRPW